MPRASSSNGTIALIEENRLVIAVACYEPLFDKAMSNVIEVKARGARVLGVALEGNRAIYSEADDVIPRTAHGRPVRRPGRRSCRCNSLHITSQSQRLRDR